LEDATNAVHKTTPELKAFLVDLEFFDIKPTQVTDITVQSFDKVKEDVDNQNKNLAKEWKKFRADNQRQ